MLYKRRITYAIRTFMISAVSVAIVSVSINAISPESTQNGSYVVMATVQPARYIVVDSNFQIIKILSNTKEDVIPYVTLDSIDGNQVPYTNDIRSQYVSLKSSLKFNQAGIIYSRNTRSTVPAAAESVVSYIRTFIFG